MKLSLKQKSDTIRSEQSRNATLQEEAKTLSSQLDTLRQENESLKSRLAAATDSSATPAADDRESNNKLQVLQTELDALQEERNSVVIERNDLRDKVGGWGLLMKQS